MKEEYRNKNMVDIGLNGENGNGKLRKIISTDK